MGIFIDGVEMPDTCKLCYLSEFSAGFYAYVCKPTGVRIDYEMAKVSKPTRICPLVSVPDQHGRLISADELIEFIENRYEITWKDDYEGGVKDACVDILEKISTMPTVIQEIKEK